MRKHFFSDRKKRKIAEVQTAIEQQRNCLLCIKPDNVSSVMFHWAAVRNGLIYDNLCDAVYDINEYFSDRQLDQLYFLKKK